MPILDHRLLKSPLSSLVEEGVRRALEVVVVDPWHCAVGTRNEQRKV